MANLERDIGDIDLKAEFEQLEKMKRRAKSDFEYTPSYYGKTSHQEIMQARNTAATAYATALLAQLELKRR